ncbi:hypothetical protein SBA2_10059 [Acidobacteriia bacterium SbA2]|nr:hypothetical protein SBA2_10059 [Acidobacteriia bacterium SbA2]
MSWLGSSSQFLVGANRRGQGWAPEGVHALPTSGGAHTLAPQVTSVLTFSHPDCTVGPGVSPDPGACRPSTLSLGILPDALR